MRVVAALTAVLTACAPSRRCTASNQMNQHATHLGAPHRAYPVHKQVVRGGALGVPNGAQQRAQVNGGVSRGGAQRAGAVEHWGRAACTPRPPV